MSLSVMALTLAAAVLGAVGARAIRLPMWPLLGAIVGAAVVHLLRPGGIGALPDGWGLLAQGLVGAAVGSSVKRGVWQEFRAMLLPATLAVVSIIGVGVIAGFVVEDASGIGHVVAVLGTVPGGVSEMVASAYALGVDGAVVAGMHIVRLVLTVLSIPLLIAVARRFERRMHARRAAPRNADSERDR